MEIIDLSYLAGFFDGEGSICILKRQTRKIGWSPEYRLQVAIGQNDGAVLDWIVSTMGGHIHKVKRDGSFYWLTSNTHAVTFLKQLLPFLKYKKPQAELAIRFYEECYDSKRRPLTKEILSKREKFLLEMKRMKRVFSDAALVSIRQRSQVQRLTEETPLKEM